MHLQVTATEAIIIYSDLRMIRVIKTAVLSTILAEYPDVLNVDDLATWVNLQGPGAANVVSIQRVTIEEGEVENSTEPQAVAVVVLA